MRHIPVEHELLREMAMFALEHSLYVTIPASTLLELLRELETLKKEKKDES